ncbi:tRNA adenylyltransferase, CCA-adding [Natronomonas pharaonis DSM 2160]|uniref:CCA-adding enzyme n=1 Tax=Natronomonas pharaonis (strain ATCC 35678 / DSM 2160 / CIP 103997 / JCM 8858 / NBRC 14720 / NCIMB 2260 / Gabara) TaxID=348780 RepID=A0A1U7ETL0_NATPD|nr:CCA tRNA nucleotidyltransferase [Natronomonas pharaonis]CAI48251.1 tRNA adenylyltransferase, CCA-adding [Natronomonas pharaonis DSM 2160]
MSLESVLSSVRDRVVPEASEQEALQAAVAKLTARAEAAITDLPVTADTRLVGSTARGTWLAGDRDIDLFVRFPPDLDRERLETYGLEVGHAVLPDGHEEFAEHPYVKGSYRGFDVDCVPCYAVADATDIRSAVDRTPFHTEYLDGRIERLADDVRLAKAFLTGIGVYGSDLRTRGFSGFLTELLVVEYGGFEALVEAAADWQPPVRLDPKSHGQRSFDDPLVVVDPTDPERNVAAVCSAANVARLIHYARDLQTDPRASLFEPADPEPLSPAAVRKRVSERGTTPVAVRFDAPDIVDDQLYPQLDKSLNGIEGALDRAGFDPLRSARFADESAVLFVECAVAERPAIEHHAGPPVGVRDHAEGFYDAYADSDAVSGPFIDEDGRYAVERARDARTPAALLREQLFDVSLGTHVADALADDYEILSGEEVASLAPSFGTELAAYFDPKP